MPCGEPTALFLRFRHDVDPCARLTPRSPAATDYHMLNHSRTRCADRCNARLGAFIDGASSRSPEPSRRPELSRLSNRAGASQLASSRSRRYLRKLVQIRAARSEERSLRRLAGARTWRPHLRDALNSHWFELGMSKCPGLGDFRYPRWARLCIGFGLWLSVWHQVRDRAAGLHDRPAGRQERYLRRGGRGGSASDEGNSVRPSVGPATRAGRRHRGCGQRPWTIRPCAASR